MTTIGQSDPVLANSQGRPRRMPYNRSGETRELAERTAAFIARADENRARTGEPWLTICAFNSPHAPATPSQWALDNPDYDHAGEEVWNGAVPSLWERDPYKGREVAGLPGLTTSEKQEVRARWRGAMREVGDVDRGIQTLLSAVDLAETHVVFCTDNSAHFGEHNLINKSQPYEESARTHLWVAGPATVPGARDDLVSNVDITATVLELAGLEPGEGADGQSLLPAVVDAEGRERRPELLITLPPDPTPGKDMGGWEAIRTVEPEDTLYVEREDTGERELYDMGADPHQLHSLQAEPDRVSQVDALSAKLSGLKGASGADLRAAEMP